MDMSRINHRFYLSALLAVVTGVVFSGMISGCGATSDDGRPTSDPSLTLTVSSPITPDSEGIGTVVRANGRDTLELIAKVQGLSTSVGFYIGSEWGFFQGGYLDTADGYTYFTADRDGVATATITSNFLSGRTEVHAKSVNHKVTQYVSFDDATLSIYPSTMTLDAMNDNYAYAYARGALPPVEWWLSNTSAIEKHSVDDTTIKVFVHNQASFTGAVTLFAEDAEGQTASILISPSTSGCQTAIFTVSPGSGLSVNGPATVSLTLEDYDRQDETSVVAEVSGADLSGGATVTLTQWLAPGLFQGNYRVPATQGAYTFTTSDLLTNCQQSITTALFTMG